MRFFPTGLGPINQSINQTQQPLFSTESLNVHPCFTWYKPIRLNWSLLNETGPTGTSERAPPTPEWITQGLGQRGGGASMQLFPSSPSDLV